MRAGRPPVILPRTADQPFHGALVAELGWGRVLPRTSIDASMLAAAVAEVERWEPTALAEYGIAAGVRSYEELADGPHAQVASRDYVARCPAVQS